jgi:hypothetical protein
MPSDKGSNQTADLPNLTDLISLDQATIKCGLSSSHLRLLVTRGDLWGIKLGRNWFTTEQAVKKYRESEHKPGRKPKNTN